MKIKKIMTTAVVLTAIAVLPFNFVAAGNAAKEDSKKAEQAEGKQPIFPLAQKAGLKTLAAAIEAAGLQKTLTTDGPFTVFAPTEEAFAALPAGALENLLKDPEALKKVLLYHVVSGEVKAADVVNLTEATTLNGQKVTVSTAGGVKINDANVIQTDIMAKNGVVHLIDKVLLPN